MTTYPLTPAEMTAHLRLNAHDAYATPLPGLPSQYAMVRRITAAYRNASKADRSIGTQWYPAVHALLDGLASEYPYSTDRVIGVFALTSPRVTLEQNLRSTIGVLEGVVDGLPCFGTMARAAQSFLATGLNGQSPLDWDTKGTTLTRSRKTRTFYRNLTGDEKRVTVDVWAMRVAGVDVDARLIGSRYLWVERAYQRAARILGVPPSVVQAATWGAERGGGGLDTLSEIIG